MIDSALEVLPYLLRCYPHSVLCTPSYWRCGIVHCIWTCCLVLLLWLIHSVKSVLFAYFWSEYSFYDSSCVSFWLQLVPISLTRSPYLTAWRTGRWKSSSWCSHQKVTLLQLDGWEGLKMAIVLVMAKSAFRGKLKKFGEINLFKTVR